jgi:hypothetical protein
MILAMRTTIDRAGRLAIPRALRNHIGLVGGNFPASAFLGEAGAAGSPAWGSLEAPYTMRSSAPPHGSTVGSSCRATHGHDGSTTPSA